MNSLSFLQKHFESTIFRELTMDPFFTRIPSVQKREFTYSDSEKARLGRSKDAFISLFLAKFNSTVKNGQLWQLLLWPSGQIGEIT